MNSLPLLRHCADKKRFLEFKVSYLARLRAHARSMRKRISLATPALLGMHLCASKLPLASAGALAESRKAAAAAAAAARTTAMAGARTTAAAAAAAAAAATTGRAVRRDSVSCGGCCCYAFSGMASLPHALPEGTVTLCSPLLYADERKLR
jgi:hypothetical protein